MKIYIATSRPIGKQCYDWAKDNMPAGFEFGTMEDCDIFISVLYDQLITEDFIKSKKGCFNFHPGTLPQYRGAGAYSWAIINEDGFAGVTLHLIDPSIDHGPIIDIYQTPIYSDDTAEVLFKFAEEAIFAMFKKYFIQLLDGSFKIQSIQDESKAKIYYRKDLEKAKDLTKFVRALTFKGKENAYYYNAKGEKIYLDYYA